MKTLQKQWLEVLSTGQYMLTFLFMDPFFSFRAFFLLFTSLWWLSVPYLVWLFLDQDTPCHVGRPIPVPQCQQPTEAQVDHYHVFYMKALEQLFEERKESCGRPAYTRRTSIQPWPHPSPPPGPPSP
ncbi:hypothetical protein G4228_006985 [Cervus hanglu yarkandensis]|nr:hypothetical protein G4228_006985 [Cervus hanglu yarkandensis]